MISFIIPAHNEALLVGRTIEAIHDAARRVPGAPPYEIVVACDACDDGTAEVARRGGARTIEVENRQISRTRNDGARAASREHGAHEHLYIFVDADTQVSPGAVQEAVAAVRDGCAGGGATMSFDGEIPLYATVVLAFVNRMFRVLRLTGGAFLFARRDHFDAAGGWDESVYASEEVWLAGALKKRGRFIIVRAPVVTSGRKLRTYSAVEILGTLARVGLRGRSGLTTRDNLGIWYGPRRPDPALQKAPPLPHGEARRP